MAEIAPLCGIRFDRASTGPIGPLLAPPYDVAPAAGAVTEFNISEIENVDLGSTADPHTLAAQRYCEWLERGILRRDDLPAIYVHRHTFLSEGEATTRTGIIARIRLRDWAERVILPHEGTNPGPRAERLARLCAVEANLSPLYFLCRDGQGDFRSFLDDVIGKADIHEELDRMGGNHTLHHIDDPELLSRLAQFFTARTLFVADGHHRYEAALAFRNAQRERFSRQDGPWEYVLALIAAVEDPGVIVHPTHRLVVGESIEARPLLHLLSRWFNVKEEACGGGKERDAGLFRVVLADSPQAWVVRARPGNPHMALLPERSASWQSLAVSVVEGVLQSLFGAGPLAAKRWVLPTVDAGSAIARVRAGQAAAAFLLPAPRLEDLFAVAEEGELLPPKSTWFEPKAPAGLVINDVSNSATQ